jgi:hypothetical protein
MAGFQPGAKIPDRLKWAFVRFNLHHGFPPSSGVNSIPPTEFPPVAGCISDGFRLNFLLNFILAYSILHLLWQHCCIWDPQQAEIHILRFSLVHCMRKCLAHTSPGFETKQARAEQVVRLTTFRSQKQANMSPSTRNTATEWSTLIGQSAVT